MNGIQPDVAKVLQNKTICVKVLSQLLGKLIATKPAAFRAPLHNWTTLQHLKIFNDEIWTENDSNSTRNPESPDLVPQPIVNASLSPIVQEALIVIQSKALLRGWGANCAGMRRNWVWNVNKAQRHINFLKIHGRGIYDLSMQSSTWYMGVVPSMGDDDLCRISAWSWECSNRLGVELSDTAF